MDTQTDFVKFIRRRDYRFVKELGKGACGSTVLLFDDLINESFVCKKFVPYSESDRRRLFEKFVLETKILHQVNHENVVRVFNYYLYPDALTGYILMEYVEGTHIDDFLASSPELINELFLQAVSAFSYLELKGVLHRDIRPQNLMVANGGLLKIIDFGFGKRVQQSNDFDKSVTLNWWCEPPAEFSTETYDFATEVYFVGKLFESIIQDNDLDQFKYTELLGRMCQRSPAKRVQSFAATQKHVQTDQFFEVGFSDDEIDAYREFSDSIHAQITKIERGTKYLDDVVKIQTELEGAYRTFMLEEYVPDCSTVLRCLIKGEYYRKQKGLPVRVVKAFVHTLKALSPEKRRIFISNLHTRLDSILRYDKPAIDEDIPF